MFHALIFNKYGGIRKVELSCSPFVSVFVNYGGLEQYWVKFFGTIVRSRTISGNVPTNF